MSQARSETLSTEEARRRLLALGAQRDEGDRSGRLFWSAEHHVWIQVHPLHGGRYRLTYTGDCGC